jgi:signal transduction histidine kinase/CheY-like chemotaxis protein
VLTAAGPRWFLWQGSTIFDESGRAVETQAVGRDITERKAAEEERAAAKEAAEQANLAKSKFLAAASHDLRQPMQSLLFVSNALGHHVSEEGRTHLALLETGLRSLKDLLDSLLDVSRIDSGAVQPRVEDVALAPLVDEVAATSRLMAEEKGLGLRTEVPAGLTIRSDRTLLERMLRNLVENAIRYTEQGEVAIVAKIESGRARIDVRDTGVGIPPEHQARIFDEFHQVGNQSRDRAQGLGLGLAIVRRLSRLLDHPVALVSEVGKGSIFSIRAPLGRREAGHVAPAVEPEPLTPSRTILAIDDDALVLMGVEAMLEEWGHRVLAAFDAEDAMRLLDETGARPDLIVCDYRLAQGRFGTEAVRLVREHLGTETPAIILTGETSTSGRIDIQKAGAGLAHKPITPQALQQVIERQLTTIVRR